MAKTKVKVLYPSGFPADVELYKQDKDGRDVAVDVVELDSALASQLVAQGYAEEIKAKTTKKAE